ncbi:MAG: urease accessory protein UreD [Cellvibrionaceae bacterium]|nr:urease accessory protein UreD [Cellvibrionaceae bacterium]
MNSTCFIKPAPKLERQWLAELELTFERRAPRTVMAHMRHHGPLRVQRPFYPESDGSCHLYILHPPGGLVMGDVLSLKASLGERANVLLTTPSAGKIYNTAEKHLLQRQHTEFFLQDHSCLEWLPQETIVFNGANCELSTRIHLQGEGQFLSWDMLRLGRAAGDLPFVAGYCQQKIEVFKEGRPLFVEKLQLHAGSDFMSAPYGMRDADTFATMLGTIELSKPLLLQLIAELEQLDTDFKNHWAVTQKQQLLIIRYLGPCSLSCRKGLELAWGFLRPHFSGKRALRPRIWNT